MDPDAIKVKRLVERVLACDGNVPLAALLEHLAPIDGLRAVAQKLGLSPKGFRIERAPARVLAALLAEQRDKDALDEIVALLLPSVTVEPETERAADGADKLAEMQTLLKLRDAEVERLRAELERARAAQGRARERQADLERQLEAAREELTRSQRALAEKQQEAAIVAPPREHTGDKEVRRRLRELEDEREGVLAADEALRRQLALDRSRVRELEEQVAELEKLIPARNRRKRKPVPPAPEPERRFVVPHVLPSFYKSLEGKDRRAIERAWQALMLFCTEGHAYPGLEVKQLAGQDTWSLRASLGLRVYFRPLANGDIEVLELGDREDQHTTLRRLKEK